MKVDDTTLYIQGYFKDGKPKKHKHPFKDEEQLIKLFHRLNDGYNVSSRKVKNNFSKRDIVYPNGDLFNLWTFLSNNGFKEVKPFNKLFGR